jgi:hypothetical protein
MDMAALTKKKQEVYPPAEDLSAKDEEDVPVSAKYLCLFNI